MPLLKRVLLPTQAITMATRLSRVHIFVEGKVQGVYYRDSTKLKGQQLGLTGVAYNLPDKRVEIIAEGDRTQLQTLVDWCRKGPEGAVEVGIDNKLSKKRKVTKVDVTWEFEDSEGRGREYTSFVNGGNKK